MPNFNTILLFCCRFIVIYGLLLIPWPGLDSACGRFFRDAGNLIFYRANCQHVIVFLPEDTTANPERHTKLMASNRDLLDAKGSGNWKQVDLDTRAMFWGPTAVIVALILATPLSWKRRAWALGWGLICLLGFQFFVITVWLLLEPDNSPGGLALVGLPPLGRSAVRHLVEILFFKTDLMEFVPVIIWVLVTFRHEDMAKLARNGTAKATASGSCSSTARGVM